MKKQLITLAAAFSAALIAGCGGGGSPAAATIGGSVADGYLAGAIVFLDRNGNYQLDAGEPSTTTNANGAYTLNVDPADLGRSPVVAIAVKGQTIDKDTGMTVSGGYMLSMPAAAVSGTMNGNFVSPMSTLVREKLAANPGMTMTEATTQLRNQMNLSPGIDMMADYVAGSTAGPNAAQYVTMHAAAREMAALMAGQAPLVMNANGSGADPGRYRGMMATINGNMPGITANVMAGQGMTSPFMTAMMGQMRTQLSTMPVSGGFGNYSAMFRNMTGHGSFWSYGGTPMSPMSGGMMN